MKFIFPILILCGCAAHCQSGSDTVFFDAMWHKCSADNFTFYRLIKKKNDIYIVKDHYRSGTVQMEGAYSSIDPEVKNGFFTYYFPSGYKETEGEWYNNKKHGTFRRYEDVSGRMILSEEYKNGMRNGKSVSYFKDGTIMTTVYENDRLLPGKGAVQRSPNAPQSSGAMPFMDMMFPGMGGIGTTGFINDTIKRNFNKMVPDSLKSVECTVIVNYKLDSNGFLENVDPEPNTNEYHTAAVVRSIRELHKKPQALKSGGMNCKVTVSFPQLKILTNVVYTFGTASLTGTTQFGSNMKSDYNPFGQINLTNGTLSGFMPPDTLQRYIRAKYKLTPMASDKSITATVTVKFDIDPDGKPTNIDLQGSKNKNLNKFLTSIVKEYPNWRSTLAKNKPMHAHCTLTVDFPSLGTLSMIISGKE